MTGRNRLELHIFLVRLETEAETSCETNIHSHTNTGLKDKNNIVVSMT